MTGGGVERRFQLVPLPNANKVIGVSKVQLGENCRPLEKRKGRGHEGQWVSVLYRDVVQARVVDAWSEGLVLLLHEEETCTSGGRRRLDNPRRQGVIDVRLHSFLLGA